MSINFFAIDRELEYVKKIASLSRICLSTMGHFFPEIENVVASVALESKYEIRGCHSVRTRKLGPGDVAVDMSIIVDRRLTASGAHNAASRLSRRYTLAFEVEDAKWTKRFKGL